MKILLWAQSKDSDDPLVPPLLNSNIKSNVEGGFASTELVHTVLKMNSIWKILLVSTFSLEFQRRMASFWGRGKDDGESE